MQNREMLDWSKVKTTEDLIAVFSVIFAGVSLPRDSREAQFLARYLKQNNSSSGAEPSNPS